MKELRVCEKGTLKPNCSATATSQNLEKFNVASAYIIVSKQEKSLIGTFHVLKHNIKGLI